MRAEPHIAPIRRGPVRRTVSVGLFGLAGILMLAAHCPAAAAEITPDLELFGQVEFEAAGFFRDAQFGVQERDDPSIAGQVTLLAEWLGGDVSLRLTPYGRLDPVDDRRSHWDMREAKLDATFGDWSFTLGADTVFWGKTEVQHLVDIINQTDAVEDLDDEDRLGQPMLRVGYITEIGEVSGFFMPFFRERTFPGAEGRLRINPAVNTSAPVYDTGAGKWTPSVAARFEGVFGDVDLGVSAFNGLGRDPAFFFDGRTLRPFYERITQAGIDVQYTSGATLWKGEGIFRAGQKNARFAEENFVALTGGLEHTLYGVFGSNADLGLIAEYAWDSRGNAALTSLQNDLFLGTRLALNDEADTAVLLTGAVDVTDGSTGLRLEADRRIAENWKVGLEGQAFLGIDRSGPGGGFADDHFLRLKVTYFFGIE